jgi:surface protein
MRIFGCYRSLFFLSFLSLALSMAAQVHGSTFKLAENGVTVTCEGVAVGVEGVIGDGTEKITYVAVDDTTLEHYYGTKRKRVCTTAVTNLAGFFKDNGYVHIRSIKSWDVSNVTDMSHLFAGNPPRADELDLSSWDVSGVKDMSAMFSHTNFAVPAKSTITGIDKWDVSSVTSMDYMFSYSSNIDFNLKKWNVINVKSMIDMFKNSKVIEASVSNWLVCDDVKHTDFSVGSTHPAGVLTEPNWNYSCTNQVGLNKYSALDCSSIEPGKLVIYAGKPHLVVDDSNFKDSVQKGWQVCTSHVTDMSSVFENSADIQQDLRLWDVSQVTNMQAMFKNATSFNQNISNWDVSSVINMSLMFFGASSFNQDISEWNVGAVQNMTSTFNRASQFDQNIGLWNVENVTSMYGMFLNASSFDQDLSHWQVCNVVYHNYFGQRYNKKPDWDRKSCLSFEKLSNGTVTCNGAIAGQSGIIDGETYYAVDNETIKIANVRRPDSHFCTTPVTSMHELYREASGIDDITSWDVSNVTDMSSMFYEAEFNQDISHWDVSNVTSMATMFYKNGSFDQDITGWDVRNVTDMAQMFYNAKSFKGDVSDWEVCNVKNYEDFGSGSLLTNNDLPDWNKNCLFTAIPLNNEGTLQNTSDRSPRYIVACKGFNAGSVGKIPGSNKLYTAADDATIRAPGINDYSGLCTTAVTNLNNLFNEKRSFNDDIGTWDVSNVVTMNKLFYYATTFNQDISGWNVSKVTDMSGVFSGAVRFDQDIGSWDVSNVTSMRAMFSKAKITKADLNRWDVGLVTDMSLMFSSSSYKNSLNNWDVSNVTNMDSMFTHSRRFNSSLKSWCVTNVTTMPRDFNYDSILTTENFPDWGHCPQSYTQAP